MRLLIVTAIMCMVAFPALAQKVMYSGIWDADGDGSKITTCAAKDDPFPQCRFAGHVIYPDFVDDVNCMLAGYDGEARRCGHSPGDRVMAQNGTILLENGVDYIEFPCWDVSAWLADEDTPTTVPKDRTINDPRDLTRHDATGDIATSSCATDDTGQPLIVLGLGLNSVKFKGGGQDTRTNDQFIADAKQVGTRLVQDMGTIAVNDERWFGTVDFPIYAGTVPFNCPGGTCSTSSSYTDGIGILDDRVSDDNPGRGSISQTIEAECAGTSQVCGTICVCNSSDCGAEVTGHTSTDAGWVQNRLSVGDIGYVYFLTGQTQTFPQTVRVRVDAIANANGCSTVTGGSGDTLYREITVGWDSYFESDSPDTGEQQTAWTSPWGNLKRDIDCDRSAAACEFVKPPAAFWNTNVEFSDLTFTTQDEGSGSSSDCGDAPVPFAQTSGATRTWTDANCDTGGTLKIHGGGRVTLRNASLVHNGFGFDGANMPVIPTFDRFRVENADMRILVDNFQNVEWRELEVYNSVFRGTQLLGGFTARTQVYGATFENVRMAGVQQLGEYTTESVFKDIEFINVSNDNPLFTLTCGANSNLFENIFVKQGNVVHTSSVIRGFFAWLKCDSGDELYPIEHNTFKSIHIMPPGAKPFTDDGQIAFHLQDTIGDTASCGVEGCLIHSNVFEDISMWSSDADSCLFWTWYGSGGADAAAQGGHADEVLQGNVFRNLKMRAGFPFCRYNGNSDGTAALPTDLSPDEDGAVVAGIPWAGHARMARVANMAVPLFMVSDADAFDTCTEVCNAQNRSCVDGDVMGSDGSATTCATTVSSGVNFWCNCGPYQ